MIRRLAGWVLRGLVALALLALIAGIAVVAFVASSQYRPPQAGLAPPAGPAPAIADELGWRGYGGDPGHSRYSAAAQITPANVGHLREAWTYRTGEVDRRGRWGRQGKVQATPIIAAGSLVFARRSVARSPSTRRPVPSAGSTTRTIPPTRR